MMHSTAEVMSPKVGGKEDVTSYMTTMLSNGKWRRLLCLWSIFREGEAERNNTVKKHIIVQFHLKPNLMD